MSSPVHTDTKFIEMAESVSRWSEKLLTKAPLTEEQREDIVAIQTAARGFIAYATAEMKVITENVDDKASKQHVRHELRNYLNIIVGFSRLIVKELPDNLLMDMVIVRKIHDAGENLILQVDAIQ